MHRVIVGVLVLAVGAACSSADDGTEVRAGDEPGPRAVGERTYRGSFTVLESPEHGPQLCSAVLDSFPPQCGGPDVVGWSWDEVDGEESSGGTTWGDYEVAGTWDGERLTLTEPPGDIAELAGPARAGLREPCPEPEGGWAVVDPATATQAALDAVIEQAQARDDFAGVWYDSSRAPYDEPTKLVLNIRVTGDVAAAEATCAKVWGGALCVSSGGRTQAELRAIQQELDDDLIGTSLFVSSGQDESAGVVRLEVMVDDGLQAELDERYGAGVVAVEARLQPEG